MSRAFVVNSPRFYNHFAVQLPDGRIVDCANLRTALDTAYAYNNPEEKHAVQRIFEETEETGSSRTTKKKDNKSRPTKSKTKRKSYSKKSSNES